MSSWQYSPKTDTTNSRTTEEGKTKTVLMEGRSWIRPEAEEEAHGPEDKLADTLLPKSFSRSFLSSERVTVDKDMCTYCRKPLSPDPKVVLDDMKIKCHASCFKCQVCNKPLGHLKAGDSMWVYQRMVHCESCFTITREKWRY